MRLRNVKNKNQILNNSHLIINNPEDYKGEWQKVFDNENPLYIEIGIGRGQFITKQALENKDINYIGIERFDSILARAVEKIVDDIPNLKILLLDAKDIDKIFDKEISLIYLNFSDPWPKKRHAKRRLTNEYFLVKYDHILKNPKKINFRTDNENLFIYSIESFSNYGYKLTNITFDLNKTKQLNHISTEYEDKFVKQGQKIYEVLAYKDN